MELLSLHSPPQITRLPSSSFRRRAAVENPTSFSGKALPFPSNGKRRPDARNPSFLHLRPRASGPTQVAAGSSTMTGEDNKQDMSSKDNDLAFVAGATGKVGSRTVRELLRLGFRVRAGVRSSQRAETLVQSVRQMKLDNVTGGLGTQPVEKLEIIECDLENRSRIEPAIGNASVVICCIGASEKEVFDVTGPYRIDYNATKNLVEAASNARVDHFILLTSLGTNKIGFPAAILNLFWGVLYWKRKAEEVLIASGLPYTIVRPGGMERPTDSYKETHNIVLANEDTYFGGQVSNLQVAELMASMAKHRRLSFCKIVEVIAETTAPLTPMEELLAKVPSQRDLPAEPKLEPAPLSTELGPTTSVLEKEVPRTMPLSPYTMYDDLKPPTSPTPTPRTTPDRLEEKIAEPVQAKSEPESRESIQLPALKASYHSPYMVYEDLKPPTSPTPTPSSTSKGLIDGFASASVALVSDTGNDAAGITPTIVNEKEIDQAPIQSSSYQSPDYVYDDLKPPTSPTPTPSTTPGRLEDKIADPVQAKSEPECRESIQAPALKASYHSPYMVYEDLKPPTSPTPTPSSTSTGLVDGFASASVSSVSNTGNDAAGTIPTIVNEKEIDQASIQSSSYESSEYFFSFEDMKPSTSPSLSSATASTPEDSGTQQHIKKQTSTPLSPYTMYEDLKPPSSPVPSVPKY